MSHENDKYRHSRRLHQEAAAIKRQTEILKSVSILSESNRYLLQPHRMSKHHALNCGNPRCMLCMNPRKRGEIPIQEQRHLQESARPKPGHTDE